jgi:hypothetical protein
MSLADRVVGTTEYTASEPVRPWHELEYRRLLADSDAILAEAVTPRAVVLLQRVGAGTGHHRTESPATGTLWHALEAPAPQIRAKQRSPPKPPQRRQ